MARGATVLLCVLALGGHVHPMAAHADGSPPATCDAAQRALLSSRAPEDEEAALIQMEPGLAVVTHRERQRGGKGSGPAAAPPVNNDGGIAGYLGWLPEPSPQWGLANCGLAFFGGGCTVSDCKSLADCAEKCSSCALCGAVKFLATGGGGYQCFMMKIGADFDPAAESSKGAITESNPDPSAWNYYVKEIQAEAKLVDDSLSKFCDDGSSPPFIENAENEGCGNRCSREDDCNFYTVYPKTGWCQLSRTCTRMTRTSDPASGSKTYEKVTKSNPEPVPEWVQVAYIDAYPSTDAQGDTTSFTEPNSKLSDDDINKLDFKVLKFLPDGGSAIYFDFNDRKFASRTPVEGCTPFAESETDAIAGKFTKDECCKYEVCNFGRAHCYGKVKMAFGWKSHGGCGRDPLVQYEYPCCKKTGVKIFVFATP